MIIKKPFDDFKSIVSHLETRKLLFKSRWGAFPILENNKSILVEKDKIIICFNNDMGESYTVEFTRTTHTNEIEIKNSTLGALYYFFSNVRIAKKIRVNWEKCLIQASKINVEGEEVIK